MRIDPGGFPRLDAADLRNLLDWTSHPGCAIFRALLKTRISDHEALVLRPGTEARRVDYERGGLATATFLDKMLAEGIQRWYASNQQQQEQVREEIQNGRADYRDRPQGERSGERGPE